MEGDEYRVLATSEHSFTKDTPFATDKGLVHTVTNKLVAKACTINSFVSWRILFTYEDNLVAFDNLRLAIAPLDLK